MHKAASYINKVYSSQTNSNQNEQNFRYKNIFNKIASPNKNNKNYYIIKDINTIMKTNISKNIRGFSRKNKFKLNCESKFDEMFNSYNSNNNSIHLNRMTNFLSFNSNNKNNKIINHSVSLLNIKPKSFNNFLTSDRTNDLHNINSRNLFNKISAKRFKNKLYELSKNQMYEKLFNYFPKKNVIKKFRVYKKVVAPLMNNYNFTIEDNHKSEFCY